MDRLSPEDRAEEIAIFRSQIIGVLVCRMLTRGELRRELCRLSKQAFRPPRSKRTRTYSVPTLERWYYAYRKDGVPGLKPKRRSDAGHAQALTDDERVLLLDIRRAHPAASADLILRTLIVDGRLNKGVVTASTVRRLFAAHGLPKARVRRRGHKLIERARLRWQVAEPNMLWHGDVCHAPALVLENGQRRPVRIHAMLDDASRKIIAIAAYHTEQEADMIDLLLPAIRRHGRCDTLYLDNGSTYSGKMLATFCARIGIALIHAAPYDPQARGAMERVWRTIREGVLDYIGSCTSLHDINVRLWSFVDQHYDKAPHAGLMGRSPETVFAERKREDVRVTEGKIRDAMTIRGPRRVLSDSTLSVDGVVFETHAAFLAGRTVTVARCRLDKPSKPWIEHQQHRYELFPVDPVYNSRRKRAEPPSPPRSVEFDPPKALLDRAVGRKPTRKTKREQ